MSKPLTEKNVRDRLFHPRLILKWDDYQALAAFGMPLHAFRQVTPLSQGIAISPLAHMALKTLDHPTFNRFKALRTGMRRLASPDFQGSPGPLSELGLVTAATRAELSSMHHDQVTSTLKQWGKTLSEAGIDGGRFWQETFDTLDHLMDHPRRWKSTYGGTHLKSNQQWIDWAKGEGQTSQPHQSWGWPEATHDQKIALIEAQFLAGRLDVVSMQDQSRLKLTWLAEHCDQPQAMADHLPQALQASFSHHLERVHYRAGEPLHAMDQLDDKDLVQTYDVLTKRLGQWQDVPWEQIKATDDFPLSVRHIALDTRLPQMAARHRQHKAIDFSTTPTQTPTRRARHRP